MGKALHTVVTILNNKFDEKAGHIHTHEVLLAKLIRSTHFDARRNDIDDFADERTFMKLYPSNKTIILVLCKIYLPLKYRNSMKNGPNYIVKSHLQ